MLSVAYSVPIRTELKNYDTMGDKTAVRVFGASSFNDTTSEIWIFHTASTAVDNGTTVIKPDAILSGNPGRFLLFEKMSSPEYINNVAIAGGAGNAIFYLTNDKTSTGTGLFSNVNFVCPIVNDSVNNYTYGWSYNSGTKALTVNVKTNLQQNVLSTLLGALVPALAPPTNAANGVVVSLLVKGS